MASELVSCKRRKVVCSKPSLNASETRSLNELPREILLKIFSHFGPKDLALNICKVCQRWKEVAEDVALWKALSFYCDKSSDIRRVKEVLTVAPALHSLVVHDRKCVARILKFLSHVAYLRKLILKNCYLGRDGTGFIASVVSLYPDLEGLSLEGCRPVTSAGYCLIPRLKKLSELNLSYSKELSGKTVRFIADSCKHLKKLSLDGVIQIDDQDLIHVIDRLGKQFTTLVLEGNGLTDIGYLYLNNCTRLQDLAVSLCNKMTDRGLLDGIGSLHELKSLRLTVSHNVTAQAWSTFLHRPSMTSIVLLDLSFCSCLDDEGLNGIAKRCINLKDLALCWCFRVTDAGLNVVINHCSQLRVLDLRGLECITGNGWLALLPSHLPHLKQLILTNCKNVCKKYVEELNAAVRELIVTK